MKIHSNILAFFFLTLMVWNTFQVAITYSFYCLDPITFIEQLCVNKDKPKLECKGKCQLKSVIAGSNEEDKVPVSLFSYKEIPLFVTTSFSYKLTPYFQNKNPLKEYVNLYTSINTLAIFRPPRT